MVSTSGEYCVVSRLSEHVRYVSIRHLLSLSTNWLSRSVTMQWRIVRCCPILVRLSLICAGLG